jgi:hypothetical protein
LSIKPDQSWTKAKGVVNVEYRIIYISNFGGEGYTASVIDWDGDGLVDPAIFSINEGKWEIMLSIDNYQVHELRMSFVI